MPFQSPMPHIAKAVNQIMEERLRNLEDREEIRQLFVDYGRFMDKRDFTSFSNLFAEQDGEWIGGMGSAKGAANIRKLMEETIGADPGASYNCHVFSNEIIDLKGDQANASVKWMFMAPSAEGRPQVLMMGHYEDLLIRKDGQWKFLRRTAHLDIPTEPPKG
jgi:hypothetical protein